MKKHDPLRRGVGLFEEDHKKRMGIFGGPRAPTTIHSPNPFLRGAERSAR
jgi:hypothetical protein